MKLVKSVKDVPSDPHFVIITFHESEEGSDGLTSTNYYVTIDYKEWENKILSLDVQSHVAFKVDGLAKLEKKIVIKSKTLTR